MFNTLDELERLLANKKYLVGDVLTEADWRLFVTLVRFDTAYYGHFKYNIRELREYPNLWRYTRELYNYSGIKETVNFYHIKHHYYESHPAVNPTGIVPKGSELDWNIYKSQTRNLSCLTFLGSWSWISKVKNIFSVFN